MSIETLPGMWTADRSEKEPSNELVADNIVSRPRSTLEDMAKLEGEAWQERQMEQINQIFPEFSDETYRDLSRWPDGRLKNAPVAHNSFLGAIKLLEMTRRSTEKNISINKGHKASEAKKPIYVIFGEGDRKWSIARNGQVMFLREGSTEQQRRQARDIGFKVY